MKIILLHHCRTWLLLLLAATVACGADPAEWAEANVDQLIPLYEHLHQHPELSLRELETAKRIAAEFESAGLDVTTEVGGHGVVGMLRSGDGPLLLLRTDLDALPVREQTELPYASRVTTENPDGGASGPVGVGAANDRQPRAGANRAGGDHRRRDPGQVEAQHHRR